jgi:hypothetical protein
MTCHRTTSEAEYSARPSSYLAHRSVAASPIMTGTHTEQHSYDPSVEYHGSSRSRHGHFDNLRLPPIRDLDLPVGYGPASRDSIFQSSALSTIEQQPLIRNEARSTATSPFLTPENSFLSPCHENTLLEKRCVVEGDFDDSKQGLERRARNPREIVRRHFNHRTISELLYLRDNVDRCRPLFGSDNKKTASRQTPPSQVTPGKDIKTVKHCIAEQGRRTVHAIAFAEGSKRIPDVVMELASYKRGSRKAPGKHHLHLAQLFMTEFDTLLLEKQNESAEQDDQLLREEHAERLRQEKRAERAEKLLREYEHHSSLFKQDAEHNPERSPRRRSPTSEDDIVLVESPRKRRRNSPATSAASSEVGSSPFYYESHDNASGHYHRHDDTQQGELGDGGRVCQRKLATRPYHRQQHSLPLVPLVWQSFIGAMIPPEA